MKRELFGSMRPANRDSLGLVFSLGLFVMAAAHGTNAMGETGRTRAQVRDEFVEARRVGDVAAAGESGLTLRELHPQLYPARLSTAAATRQQVKTGLVEALRAGDVLAVGEVGETLRERNPSGYPAPPQGVGVTRRQVRSELAEAIRNGEIIPAGESGLTERERLSMH